VAELNESFARHWIEEKPEVVGVYIYGRGLWEKLTCTHHVERDACKGERRGPRRLGYLYRFLSLQGDRTRFDLRMYIGDRRAHEMGRKYRGEQEDEEAEKELCGVVR
jgi:hypothetical protein